jgi:hypothetical protein
MTLSESHREPNTVLLICGVQSRTPMYEGGSLGRKTHTGRFYVGDDKRTFETKEAAISLALTMALAKEDDATVYVREIGTQGAVASAQRVGNSVITKRIR